jgi:replication factor C small subunit
MNRGIDEVRNKINNFVVMRGMHKWRIVLLEEMDGLTKDAMQAIRNLMEQYSAKARFILTCNYVNRIIEPIQSRCQMVEFRELAKKDCFKRLSKILEAEGVTYDPDRVIQITDLLYPDLRSMINMAQLSVKAKKLDKIVEDFSDTLTVMDLIKARTLDDIRGVCYRLEFVEVYRYLFDHIDQIEKDKIRQTEKRLRIAEYLSRDSYIADREINFMACVLEVM